MSDRSCSAATWLRMAMTRNEICTRASSDASSLAGVPRELFVGLTIEAVYVR